MGRMTVVVSRYGFKKPAILSEAEYNSYKQIFQVEPSYNMAPKKSFWDEFEYEKWLLIGLSGGTILGLIWEALLFIPAFSFVLLIFAMLTGSAESMMNYQKFLDTKNNYYDGLKQAITSSVNYEDFVKKCLRL